MKLNFDRFSLEELGKAGTKRITVFGVILGMMQRMICTVISCKSFTIHCYTMECNLKKYAMRF